MAMFDYVRNAALQSLLNFIPLPYTGNIQIAALIGNPDPSATNGTLAEPSGNGYVRATTNNANMIAPPSYGHGVVINGTPIVFPQATGNWGTISWLAIIIQQVSDSSYHPAYYGKLRAPVTITANSPPLAILPGQMHVEVTDKCLSDLSRDSIVIASLSGTGTVPTGGYFLALLSNLPEVDGSSFNEITTPGTNNYARCPVPFGTFTNSIAGICYNGNVLNFNTPSGNWGTAPTTAWAMMDATSGGNMWWYGKMRPPIAPITTSTSPISIGIGKLSIGLDIGAWA